jgi:flagellar hook assembly protein FlgD
MQSIGGGGTGAQITAASAVSTAMGAQIMFTLSGPGQVSIQVLNVAGRPVKHVATHRACGTGANTLVWNACSDNGLKVPSGTYLIEIESHGPDGSSSRALAALRLNR